MNNMMPCPFCGGVHVAGMPAHRYPGIRYYMFRCTTCNASVKAPSKESAVALWNTRASTATQEEHG
jgi:Lar family restriction alleviation protein